MSDLNFYQQQEQKIIEKNFQEIERLKAMMVSIKDELGEGYFLSPCGFYISSAEVHHLAKINIYSCEIAVSNIEIVHCSEITVRKDHRPKTIKDAVNFIKRADKLYRQYYKSLDDKTARLEDMKKFVETLSIKNFVCIDEENEKYKFSISNLTKEQIQKINDLSQQILKMTI